MRPNIIIDLDDTLIDSALVKRVLFDAALEAGFSYSTILRAYKTTKEKGFSPKKFAQALNKNRSAELTKNLETALENIPSVTFPGVKEFLCTIAVKTNIIFLTFGDSGYQRLKAKKAGLKKFAKRIVVTKETDKKKRLKTLARGSPQSIYFIDDNRHALRNAKDIGIKTVQIKKGFKNKSYFSTLTTRIEKLMKLDSEQ